MDKETTLFLVILSAILIFLPLTNHANAQSYDLNPHVQMYLNKPQMPAPVGIASYGLYSTSDGYKPYAIETDRIIAKTTISELEANAILPPQPNTQAYQNYVTGYLHMPTYSKCTSGPEYSVSKTDVNNGANLQFNVIMIVKTADNPQIIWLQDTARFNTRSMTVNIPHDIVANLTSPSSENLAYGNGKSASKNNSYYEYEGSCYRYQLPLTIVYEIDVQKLTNNLVQVLFKNNGKTFDTVYLPIPNVESAHIIVAPNKHQIPFDAELVWTGYCCAQESTFTNMDSTLSMYYKGKNGKMDIFPSLFTFGAETAETSTNLLVEKDPPHGHVVIGQNNNFFLEDNLRRSTNGSNTVTNTGPSTGNDTVIPQWIKNNAKWWADGTIDDSTFASGIQYLIKQGIIEVPATQTGSSISQTIPSWVKNTAGWWANGQVSDDDFIKAVQYLVSSGIIQASS